MINMLSLFEGIFDEASTTDESLSYPEGRALINALLHKCYAVQGDNSVELLRLAEGVDIVNLLWSIVTTNACPLFKPSTTGLASIFQDYDTLTGLLNVVGGDTRWLIL